MQPGSGSLSISVSLSSHRYGHILNRANTSTLVRGTPQMHIYDINNVAVVWALSGLTATQRARERVSSQRVRQSERGGRNFSSLIAIVFHFDGVDLLRPLRRQRVRVKMSFEVTAIMCVILRTTKMSV